MKGAGVEVGVDWSLSTLLHSPSPWSHGWGLTAEGGSSGGWVKQGGATEQWWTANLPTVNLQKTEVQN